MKYLISLLFFFSALAISDTVTRIIDTGGGTATITRFDNGEVMIYDTGHWSHDAHVIDKILEFAGDNTSEISLLIASHSDSDHIAATDEVFANFHVKKVIRTGFERDTDTWKSHNAAIIQAANEGLTHDINLAKVTLPHGTVFKFGSSKVTYLSGFHKPPTSWGLKGSEFRNGNSIVVRVEDGDNSILLTGDAVGRVEDSEPDAPAIATEKFLIDNSVTRPIDSDILLASHHGSDDGSSKGFIKAVAARWIIFPAGHAHGHPKEITAKRFLSLGYSEKCLLRTDLGDHERNKGEWEFGRIINHSDKIGDDAIDVFLPSSGKPIVNYLGKEPVNCEQKLQPTEVNTTNAIIKKSRNGICHNSSSSWFARTKKYTSFNSLDSCLESGGRLPK